MTAACLIVYLTNTNQLSDRKPKLSWKFELTRYNHYLFNNGSLITSEVTSDVLRSNFRRFKGVIVKFSFRICIDLTGVPDRGLSVRTPERYG